MDSNTVDVRQSRARTARRVRLGYGPKPRTNPRVITPAAVCVGRLGSGSRFVGRIGSGVRVSASKKIPTGFCPTATKRGAYNLGGFYPGGDFDLPCNANQRMIKKMTCGIILKSNLRFSGGIFTKLN